MSDLWEVQEFILPQGWVRCPGFPWENMSKDNCLRWIAGATKWSNKPKEYRVYKVVPERNKVISPIKAWLDLWF